MKVKWRTHELILLTIAFIGFCLTYIWEHLTPEMTAINHQYIEVFGKTIWSLACSTTRYFLKLVYQRSATWLS